MESSIFSLNSQLSLHFYSNHHQSKHSLAVTVQSVTVRRTERHWPCSLEQYNIDKEISYEHTKKYKHLSLCVKSRLLDNQIYGPESAFSGLEWSRSVYRGEAICAEKWVDFKCCQYVPRKGTDEHTAVISTFHRRQRYISIHRVYWRLQLSFIFSSHFLSISIFPNCPSLLNSIFTSF